MKLDTAKNGLEAIFKEWQIPLVKELFNRSLKSSEAHAFLKDIGARTSGKNIKGSVSRASIIFFLNGFW